MDTGGMSGMSHSGHDMSSMTMSGGIFTPTDTSIARAFWYAIAAFVALLMLVRATSAVEIWQRLRVHRQRIASVPSRPTSRLSQAYATATATVRELIYPQPIYFTGRLTKYLTPLSVGKWLLLVMYWIMVLCMLWSNTILQPRDALYAYKWEIIGFRAAWVTVTQIPLVYLLSCKFNPISVLTGISYERFNWLHRWVARTVFLTAIVHWSTFYAEWTFYNMVTLQFNLMPMVKYGFGAWGIITWMMISGFGLFRDLSYELFVFQHIIAAAVLLWALFMHVPSYARYNIWLSVAFVVFDWTALATRSALEELPGNVIRLVIDETDLKWKAGQHVYLTIPALRPFETHPFTVANAYNATSANEQSSLQMVVQTRSGFSKALQKAAKTGNEHGYRAFLSGPWGNPPDLLHYDTVVLIGCSTGASFVVPLLQRIVRKRGCIRTISVHWIIRDEEHFLWFGRDLESLVEQTQGSDLSLQVVVHVTESKLVPEQRSTLQSSCGSTCTASPSDPVTAANVLLGSRSGRGSTLSSTDSLLSEKRQWLSGQREVNNITKSYHGRPLLDALIRPAVEEAIGETAVVVCGGTSVTAETRTYVAALSDERAVHKGTGAQGICLFTETYGW